MSKKKETRLKDKAKEQLPPIAIGHVTLSVSDVGRAADFYQMLGLRPVFDREELAILELRGGTHLILFRARRKPEAGRVRSFDFMVEDIEATHAAMGRAGIEATAIGEDKISGHLWFEITDLDGYVLKVFSSHTEGRPV